MITALLNRMCYISHTKCESMFLLWLEKLGIRQQPYSLCFSIEIDILSIVTLLLFFKSVSVAHHSNFIQNIAHWIMMIKLYNNLIEMSSNQKRNLCLLFLLMLTVHSAQGFEFRELLVTAASYVTNATTTYTISYERYRNQFFSNTAWLTTPLTTADTVTLTFPNQFAITSGVTCSYSINSTGVYTSNACSVLGNVVTLSNLFSNTTVNTFSLIIGNVVNPYPAGQTSVFSGTIGADVSYAATAGASNTVIITTALSVCSFTFNPNLVYTSPTDLIMTLTTVNEFPLAGTIGVQFPSNRKWSQDLDTARTMPITTGAMVCNSQSANVNSALQCTGNQANADVSLSNVASANLPAGSTLVFSINSFNSPPTNQAVDPVVVTTYTSTGASIDQCTAYVTGLLPKTIPSSQFAIGEPNGSPIIVNQLSTIRISITTVDIISYTDKMTVTLPTGTTFSSFSSSAIQGNLGINAAQTSFTSPTLTISFTGSGTIPASFQLFILVPNFQSPASTLTTNNFDLTIQSSQGFPKMTSTQTITATPGSLSGSATPGLLPVNTVTSYTFSVTTSGPLTSSGSMKLAFPPVLSIANSASCAVLAGTNMATGPTCAYSSLDNSITFSSLNSSVADIPAQTFTLTVNGVTNPPSTQTTGTFTLTTTYSSAGGSVDTGTITGVTATGGSIDHNLASISSSSAVNSATAVSYSTTFTVNNPIPPGGYIIVNYPTAVTFDTAAAGSSCQISINNATASPTSCTASLGSSYVFNFTNPLSSSAPAGTVLSLTVAGAATNPPSTQPFSPFSIYTYHSDGTLIASLVNALTFATTIPSSLSSAQFSRLSNTNAQLTTYTLSLIQPGDIQALGKILVTFPTQIQAFPNTSCSILYNGLTSNVGCTRSGNIFTVTSIGSVIPGGQSFQVSFDNIRNPYSFTAMGGFSITTKTANDLYFYSTGTTTNTLQNTVATPFTTLTYTYTPQELSSPISLQLNFALSQSTLLPTYLLLSIDSYFTIGTLSCTSFLNFVGNCSSISSNTLRVDGVFNNSVMGLTVNGFSSITTAPSGTTFTTLASFDSSSGKIDQNLQTVAFALACPLPCKTCDSVNTSLCLSCYSNTAITTSLYLYSTLSNCYTLCPSTTYNNVTSLTCQPCDANCLNCQNSPTFCTDCHNTSGFPYLSILNSSAQICVADCGATNYPDTAVSPTTCTACVSPCATCTGQTSCITCASGFFLSGTACGTTCTTGTFIMNNSTNTCDPCNPICLTCSITTTNCLSCSAPNVFYNGSCLSACPSGGTLAPLNGICTPCDSTCLTCSLTVTNCTTCNISSANPFLMSNQCLTACPPNYYNVSVTGTCVQCATAGINCVNCASSTSCLSCDTGFVFFQSTSCLSTTPSGYVNISGIAVACTGDCKTCSVAADNCTSCNTLNLQGNNCVSTCLSGFVPISQACVACTSPCATCTTTQTTCNSCLSGLVPTVYLTGTSCQAACPNLTYANSSTLTCQPCVSPCLLCSSSATCISCVSTYFLQGTNCVLTCQSGFTGVSGLCQACTSNCKTCSGSTSHCLTCNNNTYFLNSSNSCVTTCQPTMFIDAVNQICVGCTSPCSNCVNTSTHCTSCVSGYFLFGSSCQTSCPTSMFPQGNTTCTDCSVNCTTCTSLTLCTVCSGLSILYNGACINSCPATAAVIVNNQCTPCSTQNCYSCTAANVCQVCLSGFFYLNTACITTCPSAYSNNGTHCLALNNTVIDSITSPTTFPVPFTIAGAVLVIACLMSKLQFSQTFLSGATYAFIALLQVLALVYFLFLYWLDYFSTFPVPLWIGLAGLGYLFFLNVVGTVAQPVFLCYEKEFVMWRDSSKFHSCFYGFINILSLVFSHKIRNILFCKLFTFKIFSAKLDRVDHFRIFNIFSLLSIGHSGAAIFAAAISFRYINSSYQIYYQAIDVIVLSAINVFLAFFNTSKQSNFFEEITPDGLALHKKNNLDEDHFPDKVKAEGHDGQIQQGFLNDYSHALQSKAALRFNQDSDIYSSSMSNIAEDDQYTQKQYQEISVQAVQMIDQKVNITAQTHNKSRSMAKPETEEISIQVGQLLEGQKKAKGIDLSQLPAQGFQNDSSDFTVRGYYPTQVDESVQGNMDRGVSYSVQIDVVQHDMSVQKYQDGLAVDCSIQKYDNPGQDVSIQKTSIHRNDISIQKSSISRNDRSIQQGQNVEDRSVQELVYVKQQSNQRTIVDKEDEQMQYDVDMTDEEIQPTIAYNDISVQPSLQVQQHEVAIQFEEEPNDMNYNSFQEQLRNSTSNVIFDQLEEEEEIVQPNLEEEKTEQLELRNDNVKSYQQELQERIRQKEKELTEVKRKVMMKERLNEKRQEELDKYQIRDERIELGDVKYVQQRPVAPFAKKEKAIFTQSQESVLPHQDRSDTGKPHVFVAGSGQLGLESKQMERERTQSRQQTIEEINVKDNKKEEEKREESRERTIEEIHVGVQPAKQVVNDAPPTQRKIPGRIQYREVDRSLQSHSESNPVSNRNNRPQSSSQINANQVYLQPQPEKEQSPPASKLEQYQPQPEYLQEPEEEEAPRGQKKPQPQPQTYEYQQLEDYQMQSQGRSQSTRKKYLIDHKKPKIEVVEHNQQFGQEEEQEPVQILEDSQSDIEPAGIIDRYNHQRPKFRQRSPQSDLSGTIEEIPRHFDRIDNDKTISNISVKKNTRQNRPEDIPDNRYRNPAQNQHRSNNTTKLNQKDVFDYYSGQINNNMNPKSKPKQMPRDSQDSHPVGKFNAGRRERDDEPIMPRGATSGQTRGSTFAMAGRAQFTDELKKKEREKKNPLQTRQMWEAQNEQRMNPNEGTRQNRNVPANNRQNLVKNKQLQNFASHLVLPQQSDNKQTTSFQKEVHRKQKEDKPVSEKMVEFVPKQKRQELDQIEVHFQAEQFSQDLSARGRNVAPEMPRTKFNSQKFTSQEGGSDYYNDDSEELDYKGMVMMGQMQQRPNNDDLQQYYRRKNSKQRRKKSNNKMDKSTEKIYMQRLDKRK